MTMGANAPAILVVPKGWIRKRRIKMAAVTPTTVPFEIVGSTTLRPCTAPRTDWAGVKTPSEITIETARAPIFLRKALRNCSSRDHGVYAGRCAQDHQIDVFSFVQEMLRVGHGSRCSSTDLVSSTPPG